MTTLIFDWSDWDGPATGHVIVTRRTWRRAPESLHVPWQVVLPVDGRATLDVAHVAGEAVSIRWAPRGASSRTDHVLIPDGGEHLAHLLDRVDPSTLEPLPEDLPSAFDLVARAEEAARVATATTATVTESSQRAVNAAEQARDAATLSQESALSVMPMLSGSVTITPQGGTLAVDLGRAVNVAAGLAGTSGAVDVTFPEHLCDQATLVVLRFRPVKNVGDGRPGFSVRASVFVNTGDPRAVEVRMTLTRGTDEVGGGSIPWFRADANDISSKSGVMGLNAKDLAAGQGLKLKVVMFVRPLVP